MLLTLIFFMFLFNILEVISLIFQIGTYEVLILNHMNVLEKYLIFQST